MLTLLPQALRPAPNLEPSPLLRFLAGEFAWRVAERWPAPHAVFLTASAERRHLVCLALAESGGTPAPDLDRLLHSPLHRAIRLALGRSLAGLARALARLGETAWPAQDYLRLTELLERHDAAKVLRHAAKITPDAVRGLHLLPAPLVKVGLGRLNLSADQAAIVAEGCAALANHRSADLWESAPLRWADAATPAALVEHIRNDLEPDLPPPAVPGSERLVPLTTRAAIRDAALRYRNCLRRQVHNAAGGWSVFFEWRGDPGAIVEIYRDPLFGWRFDQARLLGNKPVLEPLRGEIISELRRLGIHVGRADWELTEALDESAKPGFKLTAIETLVGEKFGDE